ncbi:methyl-accepting chemotaxis protein [Marinomonas foliarum]|jgi:methyl-accepting chemotaxis protein|uniref:Methyl-accepting chemotaxis protein n=1 Tax=Marinomonas foliarum TaxID=491950 RepID=A0A369ADT8_9GAMM|nr:methyl-accepting chemotaxis protein [Marinomonas foliarum]QRV23660.1 methyl-accepting chemotaxis protein [Marinomonas foliarum]RCX07265.1 methyl-accepting chemotaxis sensory transducer with Cache sensor [Marinomonas foliarum]
MKIKTKLLIAFSVATVLPVLVVSTITGFLASEQALKGFSKNSGQTLGAVEATFDQFLTDIKYVVAFIAESDAISDPNAESLTTYHEKQGKAPSKIAAQNGGREADVFNLFEAIGQNNPNYVYVYTGDDSDGYMEWPGTYEYAEWHPKQRAWYTRALETPNEVALRDAYYWEPDDAVYVSAVRTYNKGNSVGGVVAVDVSIKTLTEMANKTKLGNSGSVMVVENTGTILVDALHADNNFKKITELDGEAYQTIAETSSGVVHFTLDGQNYYANVYTSPNLGWKFVGLMPAAEIYLSTVEMIKTTAVVCVLLLIAFGVVAFLMAKGLITPIESVSKHLQTLAEGEGDLTSQIAINTKDETGTLSNWFNQFIETTRKLIVGIKKSSIQIDKIAAETSAKASEVAQSATTQLQSIELIAEAGQQMLIASNEAAESCANSAQFSEKGLETTIAGKKLLKSSAEGVNRLGTRLKESNQIITELQKETTNINQILSTIQGIAEQTNLLALNAAIEAARAGEQGRGFAVVADEVRTLAGRTQESTEQISNILGLLANRTKQASDSMVISVTESENAINLSDQALVSFEQIEEVVKQMRDMTMQTAASAEEQRAVTEGVNENINSISESAHRVSAISGDVAELCQKQDELSKQLHVMVVRFRTE